MIEYLYTNQDKFEDITDPDLPCYHSEEFRDIMPSLEFVLDMYNGRSAWYRPNGYGTGLIIDAVKAIQYLPKEPDEKENDYVARLSRSYFQKFFKSAIQGFVGYLSSFTLLENNIHPSFLEHLENIDRKGNNLNAFLRKADIKSIRDKNCYVYIEFPKTPKVDSFAKQQELNLTPYLILIDRRNLINWEFDEDNTTLNSVTIKETYRSNVGRYGSEVKTRYRIVYRGYYEVWEIIEKQPVLVDSGNISIPYIPLVPYSVFLDEDDVFLGEPPLYDLAELNLKHYQKTSEKDEVMHQCNIPLLNLNPRTPTSTLGKLSNANPPEEPPSVSIGAKTCLWNVDAKFVEPSGSAIASTQSDIEKLELAIEKQTLNFISWGNQVQRTATEIQGASAPIQANLTSIAKAKESAVQQICWFWNMYYSHNIPRDDVGTIEINKEILNKALYSASTGILMTMRKDGDLTEETYLKLMKINKVLPPDFDVDLEISNLNKTKQVNQEMALNQVAQVEQIKSSFK
jgi:hypothetical protein